MVRILRTLKLSQLKKGEEDEKDDNDDDGVKLDAMDIASSLQWESFQGKGEKKEASHR